jgi:ABC-2 type transport system permease protein
MPMDRSFSYRVTRWIGRRLGRFGVDAEQYHFLLQASLKLDFRSAGSVLKPQEQSYTASALKFTLLLNLIFSLMMSLMMLVLGPSTFVFSAMLLGYAMVMVAMSVLIEFGLAVISPDDFQVLAHRPISSRTFFAVKSSNLLFYVLLLGTSLNLAPALVGVACHGSQLHFPLAYLFIASIASVFVGATMVALYGFLLRTLRHERLKDLLVYAQIAFSFIFFLGFQLFPRALSNMNAVSTEDRVSSWALAFPSVWFAGVIEFMLGHVSAKTGGLAAVALIVCTVVVPLALKNVSLDYSEQLSRIDASSSKSAKSGVIRRGGIGGWFSRFFLRDSEERAFFHFFLTMFRRNRLLKLQILPNFGVAIAMMAVVLIQGDRMQNPFEKMSFTPATMFSIMAFLFTAMGVTMALPYSDEYQGGWIFPVAPIENRARILTALKKVVLLLLLAPLFLINWAVFAYFWPWHHAFGQSIYALVVGVFALQLLLFLLSDFPFSRKLEKGAASKRVMFVLMVYAVVSIAVALPYLVASRPTWFFSVVAVLLGISLLLGRFNNRRYIRKTALSAE